MSNITSRIVKISKIVGFTTLILMPVELARTVAIGLGAFPMIVFMGCEYIITGDVNNIESIVNFVEFGGQKTIQQISDDYNIMDSKMYIYNRSKLK